MFAVCLLQDGVDIEMLIEEPDNIDLTTQILTTNNGRFHTWPHTSVLTDLHFNFYKFISFIWWVIGQ